MGKIGKGESIDKQCGLVSREGGKLDKIVMLRLCEAFASEKLRRKLLSQKVLRQQDFGRQSLALAI
jgi:hypothetical protein